MCSSLRKVKTNIVRVKNKYTIPRTYELHKIKMKREESCETMCEDENLNHTQDFWPGQHYFTIISKNFCIFSVDLGYSKLERFSSVESWIFEFFFFHPIGLPATVFLFEKYSTDYFWLFFQGIVWGSPCLMDATLWHIICSLWFCNSSRILIPEGWWEPRCNSPLIASPIYSMKIVPVKVQCVPSL